SESGAIVDAKNDNGRTALMLAAELTEDPKIITTLVKNGAAVNIEDNDGYTTLMHAAVHNQNPEIITTLIKYGANVNKQNVMGKTALITAAESNQNPEIIMALIKNGANINARAPKWGIVLPFMIQSSTSPLTNNKVNFQDKENIGATALMAAAALNQNPDIVTTLIMNGANVKLKNVDGKTALDYAKDNSYIYNTKAYWLLSDKMYEDEIN
ncbi:MAG TPA: hypothetical protein DIC64_05365, partial [Alphaproteobacteria bacterium]|nr:hypothetical protein [Alphaproteobacteria bacterium]